MNGVSPAPPPADRAALAQPSWGSRRTRRCSSRVGRLVPAEEPRARAARARARPRRDARDPRRGPAARRPRGARQPRRRRRTRRASGVRPRRARDHGRGRRDRAPVALGGPAARRARGAGRRHAARATAVRGVRELLDDGRTALLVPEDAEALAAAIRRVLEDGALAAALGRPASGSRAATPKMRWWRRICACTRRWRGEPARPSSRLRSMRHATIGAVDLVCPRPDLPRRGDGGRRRRLDGRERPRSRRPTAIPCASCARRTEGSRPPATAASARPPAS